MRTGQRDLCTPLFIRIWYLWHITYTEIIIINNLRARVKFTHTLARERRNSVQHSETKYKPAIFHKRTNPTSAYVTLSVLIFPHGRRKSAFPQGVYTSRRCVIGGVYKRPIKRHDKTDGELRSFHRPRCEGLQRMYMYMYVGYNRDCVQVQQNSLQLFSSSYGINKIKTNLCVHKFILIWKIKCSRQWRLINVH